MSLEATLMTYNRLISTTVLFVLVGTTIPRRFAQQAKAEKQRRAERKAPQAQPRRDPSTPEKPPALREGSTQHQAEPQRADKVAPQQRAQKAEPQRAAEDPRRNARRKSRRSGRRWRARPAVRGEQTGPIPAIVGTATTTTGNYGRISNANYSSHFGHDHSLPHGTSRR